MTTARKLWLGFGTLVLLLVITGVVIASRLTTLKRNVHEMTAVEEPLSAAAYEMEINVIVWRYLATGEPRARARVAKDAADFQRFQAQYNRLARTPEYQELGRRAGALYERYNALGHALMDQRDRQQPPSPEQLREFAELRTQLDDILDDGIQKLVQRDLQAVTQSSLETSDAVLTTVLILLVGGVLIGGTTAVAIGRRIVRAEAGLREQRAWLRGTLTSIGDAVIATDASENVTFLSRVAESLTGWTEDEALGKPLDSVFPIVNEESRQPVENPVKRVLEEGVIAGLANHTVLIARDGTERPIDDSAAPIRAADDRLVGVVMVFRDITERRQAERERAALLEREQAARAEAERVARILRHVQMVTGAALGDVSLDGLMREFLAHVRTAMAGDTATILRLAEDGAYLVPVSSDGLREELAEDLRIPLGRGVAGRVAVSEAGMIFDDLTDVEVCSPFLGDRVKSLVGAPLRVGNRLIGVVHVGASVPQGFTEEDLTLLGMVADRVALILERARLHEAERAARSEAEAANRAKDEFLATVSHELRGPLSAIVSWAEVVRAGKRDEVTVARALETIVRNAKLQERLITDLLDVSQIVTGRLRLDIEPVDLAAVIRAAIDVVRPATDAKGIRVETVLDPSASFVSGDPGRLQQVLWNLLSNAVKFTPKGGRVEVRLHRVDSRAELAVSDTGEGISAEFLPHVFERFRQADRLSGRRQGGLGLGLAIVRHLVELHGGTVHADSPGKGQGATFTVKLPLRPSGSRRAGSRGCRSRPRWCLPACECSSSRTRPTHARC